MKILMTISGREAAEILGIKEHTLANWRYSGMGPPFFRSGRTIRYIYDEVMKFIEKNRAG